MATQWPLVKARLLTLLPTLSGWSAVDIYNGPPVGGVGDVYATVGWSPTQTEGGTYTTTQSPDGGLYIEQGQIVGLVVAASGDDDLATVEAQAFALMDALDAYIRTDRRIGVLSPEGTTDLTVNPIPTANGDGTVSTLHFALTYFTVT